MNEQIEEYILSSDVETVHIGLELLQTIYPSSQDRLDFLKPIIEVITDNDNEGIIKIAVWHKQSATWINIGGRYCNTPWTERMIQMFKPINHYDKTTG